MAKEENEDVPAPVIIVDYDARWPGLYREEEARVLQAVGDRIAAIEHIGSTAVPGLAAKPIIDMMVAVRKLADADECIEPLQALGWLYAPENEVETPERRYFDMGLPGARTHHLHMVELASDWWVRHLAFRDFLRAHSQTAQEYERLKRGLAARYRDDREAYTTAKTEFIQSVVARAVGRRNTCSYGSTSSP